jgi:hypothetical protein
VRLGKPLDINFNGIPDESGVSLELTAFPANKGTPPNCTTTDGDPDSARVLLCEVDTQRLRFVSHHWSTWIRDGNVSSNASEPVDLPGARVSRISEAQRIDCNQNGVADATEIAAGAKDLDGDGFLDSCDGSRIIEVLDAPATCPAGDADSLRFRVALDGVSWANLDDSALVVRAVRLPVTSDTFWVWRSGRGVVTLDTLLAVYDPSDRVATFGETMVSGTGSLALQVFIGARLIEDTCFFRVRGFDGDSHAVGSVDHLDTLGFTAALGSTAPGQKFDFDRNGTVTLADRTLLVGHLGHHVPRQLLNENGGEVLAWGTSVNHHWLRGVGDSALVSFYLLRDGIPGWEELLGQNAADDGTETWPEYPTDATRSDYRLKVVHTVGARRSNNLYGTDASDGTFTVTAASGGCPTVDISTGSGWTTVNTILGRTLDASTISDALHLAGIAAESDVFRVRVRENESELTRIDQVSLVAVDHRPDVEAMSSEGRFHLGVSRPAARAITRTGIDISSLLQPGGDGFYAAAGETLVVELGAEQASGELAVDGSSGGGGGFEEGDGGGKGPAPAGLLAKAFDSRSVDVEILGTTGILIQVPTARGGWETVKHYYPREREDRNLFDNVLSNPVRLVFLDGHHVNFLGRFEWILDSFQAEELPLVAGVHSRLGDVRADVDARDDKRAVLQVGDTLSLSFANKALPRGLVRDVFLVANGAYTSAFQTSPPVPDLPVRYALGRNRPNPFRRSTRVFFDVPRTSVVRIEIFDTQGRRVRALMHQAYEPGRYSVEWDQRDAANTLVRPGVYLYQMESGGFRSQRKMVVLP